MGPPHVVGLPIVLRALDHDVSQLRVEKVLRRQRDLLLGDFAAGQADVPYPPSVTEGIGGRSGLCLVGHRGSIEEVAEGRQNCWFPVKRRGERPRVLQGAGTHRGGARIRDAPEASGSSPMKRAPISRRAAPPRRNAPESAGERPVPSGERLIPAVTRPNLPGRGSSPAYCARIHQGAARPRRGEAHPWRTAPE